MRLLEIYQEWLEHDGKIIKIDGVNHLLRVSTLDAIYPRPAKLISVQDRMGDHWSTDVLDSDIELAADILSQARAVAAK